MTTTENLVNIAVSSFHGIYLLEMTTIENTFESANCFSTGIYLLEMITTENFGRYPNLKN